MGTLCDDYTQISPFRNKSQKLHQQLKDKKYTQEIETHTSGADAICF